MRKIFDPESGIMQALGDLCDLVVLNLFALLCSIPVVTFGASVCGMFTALREKRLGRSKLYRSFFRGFKRHFYRATIAHLIMTGILAYLICSYWLLGIRVCLLLCFILGILFAMFASWYYPLLIYADEDASGLIKRACMCGVGYLPRTLAMTIVNVAPLVMILAAKWTFIRYFSWILLFWFALAAVISRLMMKKPLKDMGFSEEYSDM